jgi:hypothetical protein
MRALALTALLLPLPALAEPGTHDPAVFASFAAGIVCAEAPFRQDPAPDTITGFVSIVEGGTSVGLATTIVPALPGLAFGIVARHGDTRRDGVTVTVTHPPMGPEGVTVETWSADFGAGAEIANFFSFDEDYERVPGPWRMEASHDGQMLYAVDFTVIGPAAWPDFRNPCEEPPPIS